jgi:hypothetical protein
VEGIGKRLWAIPEGYIPSGSVSQTRELVSHEAVCLLNTGDEESEVTITMFFADREPAGPYRVNVGSRRTKQRALQRFSRPGTRSPRHRRRLIEASVPIVVQQTRLDSRDPSLALQPEMNADAIFQTVLDPRRERWIGWSTCKTTLGNMLAPGLLDRYLTGMAVHGQETRMPVASGRRDNLMRPVGQLHRTRGNFRKEAASKALVVDGGLARLAPVVAGAATFLVAGLLISRSLRARPQ